MIRLADRIEKLLDPQHSTILTSLIYLVDLSLGQDDIFPSPLSPLPLHLCFESENEYRIRRTKVLNDKTMFTQYTYIICDSLFRQVFQAPQDRKTTFVLVKRKSLLPDRKSKVYFMY